MNKYARVDAPRPSVDVDGEEVRVTTGGKMRDYVSYAAERLAVRSPRRRANRVSSGSAPRVSRHSLTSASSSRVRPQSQAEGAPRVVLTGTGRAIPKTVAVAEILKRRVAGVHQTTDITSLQMDETWTPTEVGLDEVSTSRRVTAVAVALTTDAEKMDANAPGYQAPPPPDLVTPPRSGDALASVATRRRKKAASRRKTEERDEAMGEGKRSRRRARRGRGGRNTRAASMQNS